MKLQRIIKSAATVLWGFVMAIGLTYPFNSAQARAVSTNSAAIPEADTVKTFLGGLENHDQKSMLDTLTPDAKAFRIRDGKLSVSKIEDVIAFAFHEDDTSTLLSEPIDNIGVRTFGNISTVWTTYKFYINNNLHHCGHTIYGLIRIDGHWKIASIVDEGVTACG